MKGVQKPIFMKIANIEHILVYIHEHWTSKRKQQKFFGGAEILTTVLWQKQYIHRIL